MLNGLSTPIVCAAERAFFIQSFACLKEIIEHPLLQEEEKYLWLWLCYQSTNNTSFPSSYSYEQMSLAVNKSSTKIHRILFRLMLMGFLESNSIPIWYGTPTLEMVQEIRALKLIFPPKPYPVNKFINFY